MHHKFVFHFPFVYFVTGNCYINQNDYQHGEVDVIKCRNCSCNDGTMKCERLLCPPLTCPVEEQLDKNDCCKFCKGEQSQDPNPLISNSKRSVRQNLDAGYYENFVEDEDEGGRESGRNGAADDGDDEIVDYGDSERDDYYIIPERRRRRHHRRKRQGNGGAGGGGGGSHNDRDSIVDESSVYDLVKQKKLPMSR